MNSTELLKEISNQTTLLRNARGQTAMLQNQYADLLKTARLVESQAFEKLSALISIANAQSQ